MQKNTTLVIMKQISILALFITILIIGFTANSIINSKDYHSGSRHFGISYISLVLIAIAGYFMLQLTNKGWIAKIWLVIYVGSFCLLASVKALEKFTHLVSPQTSSSSSNLCLSLISPSIIIVFYVLAKCFKGKPMTD